jgi:hypothetical protein
MLPRKKSCSFIKIYLETIYLENSATPSEAVLLGADIKFPI